MSLTAPLEQVPTIYPGIVRANDTRHLTMRGASVIDRAAAFTVTLARWRTAMLTTRGAVEIRCLSGQLWITQLGDMRDTVLQAGQAHVLTHAIHDVVLSTVGSELPATVEILPVGKARSALWQWLQRTRLHFQLEIA